MKKLRGKKRYFRNLQKEVATEHLRLDFGKDSWFDLWHTHLDFHGHGNSSMKIRREHIKAHIGLYRSLLERLESFEKPFQSWVEIDDHDAGSDAVYIHTPNPNEDNFPLKIANVKWAVDLPYYFKDLIDPKEFDAGYYRSGLERGYIIQSKMFGHKF
ncbi:hypothetical protein HNQ44_003016 [Planomicrobium koreense]|uniref:Uncharacterized protein n=1 Tax=Planococcus koreensis TaxID=112331 RepID=A0A7W8CTX0_9BACL|nr:hypothetical protein [Planococcus koreensis]MBB5181551.1 hypothetical protein [Planococcus koreensis]